MLPQVFDVATIVLVTIISLKFKDSDIPRGYEVPL